MKKLILTSTALLAFAAASYAQINQTGLQQYAEQIRNGNNQTGTINQLQGTNTNYGNYAITIQGQQSNTGPANADINQNNGSQGNRAGITQNGGTNVFATINQNGGAEGLSGGGVSSSATIGAPGQDGNFAGIAQMGTDLQATINQNNNSRRNGAEVYQNGTTLRSTVNQSNGAINNDAFVFQGYTGQNVAGTAITNAQATINQGRVNVGDTSDGSIIPESVSSTARITQNASFTTARIDQGTTGIFFNFFSGNGRADGSQATIEQRAGSTGSEAYIEQGVSNSESFGSRATLVQTGTSNNGYIGQGGTTNVFNFFAPLGSDQGSVANLTQNGSGNPNMQSFATIIQGADGGTTLENVANLTQTTTVQNGSGLIFQGIGSGAFSANDEARITQASKATMAAPQPPDDGGPVQGITVLAEGFSGAYIYQNVIEGLVPAGAGGEVSAAAFGSATGRLNLAVIDQQANVTDGVAYIDQAHAYSGGNLTASRNTATITQVSGTNIRAIIQQSTDLYFTPDLNAVTVTDLFGNSIDEGSIATNNTGTITQNGGANHTAQLIQSGRFNTGVINQSGAATNTNAASIVQAEGANRGYAEIQQTAGVNNTARILQLSGSDTDNSGVGNYAKIQQIVGNNNLAVIQQGTALSSGSVNSSNDNTFDLIQNGSNNRVQFLQSGNNNYAMIRQNGNNNVVQAVGGGPIASQVGYGNVLRLTQNGNSSSNLVFQNTQVGNNLTAVQTQNAN